VVPIGDALGPGGGQVTITGFMQVFIQQMTGKDITATILGISGCKQSPPSTCGNGGQPGTVSPPPNSPAVIRLVQS
jgi:hypothetical protein